MMSEDREDDADGEDDNAEANGTSPTNENNDNDAPITPMPMPMPPPQETETSDQNHTEKTAEERTPAASPAAPVESEKQIEDQAAEDSDDMHDLD